MRTVALLGGAAESRDGVHKSKADEVWTINWSYLYDWVPKFDRLFEMHPIWLYAHSDNPLWAKPKRHWEWLQSPRPYPIYMLEQRPEVPACVRYPIEDITKELFGRRLVRGAQPQAFYSSSVDYMMALAIYEGFDVIEMYGIEMGGMTEYRYQREGCAFWIGQAIARGITVVRPEKSHLLKNKLYGYEGGQMIFRHDLEAHLNRWDEIRAVEVAKLQAIEGELNHMKNNGSSPDDIEEMQTKRWMQYANAFAAKCCFEEVAYMIREVDLEEPEIKLAQPFAMTAFNGDG